MVSSLFYFIHVVSWENWTVQSRLSFWGCSDILCTADWWHVDSLSFRLSMGLPEQNLSILWGEIQTGFVYLLGNRHIFTSISHLGTEWTQYAMKNWTQIEDNAHTLTLTWKMNYYKANKYESSAFSSYWWSSITVNLLSEEFILGQVQHSSYVKILWLLES